MNMEDTTRYPVSIQRHFIQSLPFILVSTGIFASVYYFGLLVWIGMPPLTLNYFSFTFFATYWGADLISFYRTGQSTTYKYMSPAKLALSFCAGIVGALGLFALLAKF